MYLIHVLQMLRILITSAATAVLITCTAAQSQQDDLAPVPESQVPVFPKFTFRDFSTVKRLLR